MGLAGYSSAYVGYLWPCSFQGHFGSCRGTFEFSYFGPNDKRQEKIFRVAMRAKQ